MSSFVKESRKRVLYRFIGLDFIKIKMQQSTKLLPLIDLNKPAILCKMVTIRSMMI